MSSIDRLIKDMAFHGITDKESGNKWLRERFLTEMNERFSHPPLSPENFHQEVPAGVKLNDVFVLEDNRKIHGDFLVRWNNRWFQLEGRSRAKAKENVSIQERLDGSICIIYRGLEQEYKEIKKPQKEKLLVEETKHIRAAWKPAANHPWRHANLGSKSEGRENQVTVRGHF